MDVGNLTDDLKDAWEHPLHDEERKSLMRVLFQAAARGIKVAILSGDVHVSAAFKISDGEGNSIFSADIQRRHLQLGHDPVMGFCNWRFPTTEKPRTATHSSAWR